MKEIYVSAYVLFAYKGRGYSKIPADTIQLKIRNEFPDR